MWLWFRKFSAYFWVIRLLISYKLALRKVRFMKKSRAEVFMRKVHKKNGAKLREGFFRLQGLYLKLGQLISILATALPPSFRDELTVLQDKIPPKDYKVIKPKLKEQWGKHPKDIFKKIEKIPIAAASIGQVHRATLKDGTKVVIKVQYPGLGEIVKVDLKTFKGIVWLISWFFPDAHLDRVYEEIKTVLLQELDFNLEAKNMIRFSENFKDIHEIRAPKVYEELSSSTILVAEFIDGIKINNIEKLKENEINPVEVAEILIESYANQLLDHGFYHADPHPGNLLVLPGPQIVFIDFGASCTISEMLREGMVEFIQCGVKKDTAGLINSMRKMGFIAKEADPKVYDRVVAYFHDKFHQEIGIENIKLGKISFDLKKGMENVKDFKRMNISLKDISQTFHIPKEWILLERTMLLLMGLVTELAPELDLMETFIPHLRRFSLKYGLDPGSLAMQAMRELAINSLAVPAEFRNILSKLSYGDIEIRIGDSDRAISLLYHLVHELLFGSASWFLLQASWKYEELGACERSNMLMAGAGICGLLFLRSFVKCLSFVKTK
jgi:ubiquinone biosynthesis protein